MGEGDAVGNTVGGAGGISFLVTIIVAAVTLIRHKNGCSGILGVPIIWVLLSLMVVSTILACCPKTSLLVCCNIIIILLILFLFLGFLAFSLSVTHKGGGEDLLGKAYKEYRLTDYSNWVQKRANNTKIWDKIKRCLVHHDACKRMTEDWADANVQQFYGTSLSSVESGCCKPSNDCNFTYVTPTNWIATNYSTNGTNSDCQVWNNDPNTLCFNCQACKAAVADQYKHNWFAGTPSS